jgi:hypothetical protein
MVRLLTTLWEMPGTLSWLYFALGIVWGAKKATHQEIDGGAGPRPQVAANQLKTHQTTKRQCRWWRGGILDEMQPQRDVWEGRIHVVWGGKLDDKKIK